ncbi:alkylglycerol monooxygenase-like [Bacillus rossius redtenbacheri]|uniref:alkylglycerol monooxygenase-like n=1 Tax=Bacillus rossius redtenbacheri TaxID=93214 RepID=UPI002FDCB44C
MQDASNDTGALLEPWLWPYGGGDADDWCEGRLLCAAAPSRSSFEGPELVPDYMTQAWPYLLAFLLVENALLWLEGQPTLRLNDGVTSLSHGVLHQCGRLVFRGAESAAYMYIHKHWRLADMAWDSPCTWYLAALGVDFCYYWVHRACHEVHILWAQHQVHHSSEEFNLAVGLRQSVLQEWCGFVFYLPLALFVPPAHFLTHQQFNLLYQFWLHTKVVRSLGPLEWVFNTPQHHRVHHGCNLSYLDKNYGGVLIIWDRMFGTFAQEKDDIIYGLVYNQPSFNPLFLQVFYNMNVVNKWRSMSGWQDKMAAVWKGPSWLPGKPRLGADEDKLDVKSREKYDVKLPTWCNVYLLLHFTIVVVGFQELALRHMAMSPVVVLGSVLYILLSLTSIGMLFDNHPYACALELARCLAFSCWPLARPAGALQWLFLASASFWLLQMCRLLRIHVKAK